MSAVFRLVDVCSKIGSGATPRGGKSAYLEAGPFSLIRSQNVRNEGFAHQGLAFIDEQQAAKLDGVAVEAGDVLLNITGDSVARVCQVSPQVLPARVNQHVAIIRPDAKVLDPQYLRYFMVQPSFQNYLLGMSAVGATRSALTKGMIEEFEVPKRSIQEQREIAAILGALDDKIELNRETAATLEEMARALYRSWFVDFDPVHARSQGLPPAHMPPTTAALFPDSFGDDGLPEGWNIEALSLHLDVHRGLSYKGKHLCSDGEGVPLHNLNSILEGGGYKDAGIKYYNGEFKPRHEIRPGDIIVANTEQGFGFQLIGHSAIVPHWLGPSGLFSQHLYKIEPKVSSPLTKEWLYMMFSISQYGRVIRNYSNGTTVNMLPADSLQVPEILIPSSETVGAFNSLAEPMRLNQENLRLENQTLANLRDTLLPRLMSGELRVGDARELVEGVV